jgi:Cd2+/Zn2+-exporting ATPase
MSTPGKADGNWTEDLVRFLCEQPGVGAVRLDPAAHRVSVATLGQVDLADLEARLAATIAAVEERFANQPARLAAAGFTLRRDGGAVVIGRNMSSTAEKLWLWREMEWPEIKAEPTAEDQEWRLLATLAAVCGVAGIAGLAAGYWAPGLPWLSRGLFLIGLVAGGWDAAVDSWANLKKREIDIHFLMLAVAAGALFIGAWGEAVLLLFLFSASGAMEEFALDRTQREVSALLKSTPKQVRGWGRTRDSRGRTGTPPAGACAAGRGVPGRRQRAQREERERRIEPDGRGGAGGKGPGRPRVQRHVEFVGLGGL